MSNSLHKPAHTVPDSFLRPKDNLPDSRYIWQMYKSHTKVSVFSLHHGNVFGDMEYSMYTIWATLNQRHYLFHFHTLSWSLTPYVGMVLDQRLQCHSKEYTDIYIHISFKIMFKSFTTENVASSQKHVFFLFKSTHLYGKSWFPLHFVFPQ